jgi:Ca-activated chloride channel family protein
VGLFAKDLRGLRCSTEGKVFVEVIVIVACVAVAGIAAVGAYAHRVQEKVQEEGDHVRTLTPMGAAKVASSSDEENSTKALRLLRKDGGLADAGEDDQATAGSGPVGEALNLSILFSSEKKEWVSEAIAAFNSKNVTIPDGRRIRVHAAFGGSVEPIAGIVAETTRPHVFSPASSLMLRLLDDEWARAKGTAEHPIAGTADPLALSPIVLAMWEPMARALGWPEKKVGWGDVAALARSPEGWRGKGHPEWGNFRFGHTHPEHSNSGLISVLAEVYAGAHKTRDLAQSDLGAPDTRSFLSDVEGSVVLYGPSTGFFYNALVRNGPAYLSSAALYENLVVSASQGGSLPFPLVCVYPAEGTQVADHPYAILDAPWVGAAERQAANKFKEYLLSRPVQERAMSRYGFRPALPDVPLGAPIDAAHGANPKEPQTVLGLPDVGLVQGVIDTWKQAHRGVDVVLVLDRSRTMGAPRLAGARDGLGALLHAMRPSDRATLLTFSGKVDAPSAASAPGDLAARLKSVSLAGDSALYDAIQRGYDLAGQASQTDRTRAHAVVVVTDGQDNRSRTRLPDLLTKLTAAKDGGTVPVFVVRYGEEASDDLLKKLAVRTGGSFYHGEIDDLESAYDEIGSFF